MWYFEFSAILCLYSFGERWEVERKKRENKREPNRGANKSVATGSHGVALAPIISITLLQGNVVFLPEEQVETLHGPGIV